MVLDFPKNCLEIHQSPICAYVIYFLTTKKSYFMNKWQQMSTVVQLRPWLWSTFKRRQIRKKSVTKLFIGYLYWRDKLQKNPSFFSFVLIIEHASNCEKLAYFLKLTDFPIMLLGQAQNCGLSDNSSNLRNKSTAFSEKSWLISCLICQSSTNVFWKVLCAYQPLLFIVFTVHVCQHIS